MMLYEAQHRFGHYRFLRRAGRAFQLQNRLADLAGAVGKSQGIIDFKAPAANSRPSKGYGGLHPARLLHERFCNFDITDIPKDSQLRQVLDNADNSNVYELFADLFRSLQRGKRFDLFRFIDDRYLMCLDGSGYFSSDTIHCPGCLTKTSANGHVRYERQILQPVIVCPGIRDPPRPLTRLCKELALIKTFRPKSLCRSWRNNIRKRLSSSAGKEGFLING